MKIEKLTLANGIRVIVIPQKETDLISSSVIVGTGSRYEEPKEYGLSHFLEHMVFKGTKNYPTAEKISKALENYGASVNAWTSEQATCYYNLIPKEHWNNALSVLSDMVTRPLFNQAEIDKERGPVTEELKRMHDDPYQYVYFRIADVMWPNQPIGNGIIGPEENLRRFNRADFIRYHAKHYNAANLLICIVGPVTATEAKKKLESYFSDVPAGKTVVPEAIVHGQDQPRVELTGREMKQGHIVLGYKTAGQKDRLTPATIVLNTILGTGMSSILFTEVREKRGLAYTVNSDLDFYSDAGILAIYAGLNKDKTEDTIKMIKDILSDLKEKPIPERRISEAKEFIRGITLAQTDGLARTGYWAARRGLLDPEDLDPADFLAQINKVTPKEIQQAASDIFQPQNESLVVLGPFSDEEKFAKILSEKRRIND